MAVEHGLRSTKTEHRARNADRSVCLVLVATITNSASTCMPPSVFPLEVDVGQGDATWMAKVMQLGWYDVEVSERHVRFRSVCKVCSHGRNLWGHNAT